MEHPYRWAGAIGAGIAIAGWLASRAAQRKRQQFEPPYRPALPSAPSRPVTPVTPRPPDVRPVVPPTKAETPPATVTPLPGSRSAEVNERLAIAGDTAATLTKTIRGTDAKVASLARELAEELNKMSRPGEDFAATTLRVWRQLDGEAQRQWPAANLVSRAGDIAWQAVFLAEPVGDGGHMKLADWTQTRRTTLITNERIGTDELLIRAAVAHAVVRKDQANPLGGVIELWRRGVVPDISRDSVICRRGGVVVAQAPQTPDKGVA